MNSNSQLTQYWMIKLKKYQLKKTKKKSSQSS